MEQKFNLNDNVSSETELSEEELALIQLEEDYQTAIRLLASIKCMVISDQLIDIYQKLIIDLQEMNGYKDSEDMIKTCQEKIKIAKEDLKEVTYQRAKYLKDKAKNNEDFVEAIEEFKKVRKYLDSENMIAECEKQSIIINKNKRMKTVVKSIVAACVVVILLVGANTSHAKYYYANFCMYTKAYDSAIHEYRKLHNYKDSAQKKAKCYYLWGKTLSKTKKLDDAIKAFGSAHHYKNSDDLKVAVEKKELRKSVVGDVVTFGNCQWIVLSVNKNDISMIRKNNLRGMPYNNEKGDITWEKSSIRQWLNVDYLHKAFTKDEVQVIERSTIKNNNNILYGTSGGNDTKDYLYLLSIDEANAYLPKLPAIKVNSWLRSPGNSQNAAAFYSEKGIIMEYGYDTMNQSIHVRPVLNVAI